MSDRAKYTNVHINKGLGKNIYGQEVAERNRVGYCYCQTHPGYLTEAIIKEKNCLGNNCRYLQKFEDHRFWVERKKTKDARNKKKEREKNEKLILDEFRKATYDIEGFAVTSVNQEDDHYIARCVYVYNANPYFVDKIDKVLSTISNSTGFKIKAFFIQNTYANRKEIYKRVRDNY